MTRINPFSLFLEATSGKLQPHTTHITRRVSDLRGCFVDRAATEAAIAAGDPLVYEVYQYDVPEEMGHLMCCTTVLQPGVIGDEYYMTKGHFHAVRDTAEVYLGLAGRGYLLLANEDGGSDELSMAPGAVAYVPPYWAHRTANHGDEPLVFFAIYPSHAGHDYAAARRNGFSRRALRSPTGPVLA